MGSGTEQRRRIDAVRAYRLRQQGMTNREIADTIGCDIIAIPGKVLTGERIESAQLSPGYVAQYAGNAKPLAIEKKRRRG